jgi:hypothetical protein
MGTILFAAERVDTWVIRVSIALPFICLGVVVIWQLLSYLKRKLSKPRVAARESPEPARPFDRDATPISVELEKLERDCASLAEALAQKYLELAEACVQSGQRERAAAVWQKIIERCPESRQALVAQDRLRELHAVKSSHPVQ